MAGLRQEKVARLLQKELSSLFLKIAPAIHAGCLIGINQVRISTDLAYAKIYISIMAGETVKREEILKVIQAETKKIRFELGKQVGKQLRIVPNLSFYLDDSLDYALKIDALLK